MFGSFDTNLYLPTSDIDVVVLCHWETNPQLALTKLENQLNNKGIYDDVKLILPIPQSEIDVNSNLVQN